MAAVAPSHYRETLYPASPEDDEPIIDLVHLARQTLSDEALETELLELFERQSARIVAQILEAGAAEAQTCADLAHKLKGSALAIGARRVAQSAQIYEAACAERDPGESRAALDELAAAVGEARAAIAQLLG